MKLVLALMLGLALAQASPRMRGVTPRDILIPEWSLNPRLTGSEWEAIHEANVPQPEVVENFRPGTKPQIESAGTSYADSRIIGGENAEAGQFPWQASLTLDGSYFCGGSIISDNVVLTAAHCADGIKSFYVVVGSLDPDGDSGSVHQTSRDGTVHEEYDSDTIKNDIAVVKLPTKLTFTIRISPVRLPSHSQESELFVGVTATISGWGRTSDSATGISSILKWVELKVITNREAAQTFGSAITATNICTSSDSRHATCNGDSGGPLTVQNNGEPMQVGIVSFGAAAGCAKGYPDVFTRVTAFLRWLEIHAEIVIRD